MGQFIRDRYSSFRKGDMTLLLLCLVATAFGCLAIASATNYMESKRFIVMQLIGAAGGILMYAFVSTMDLDLMAERKWRIVAANMLFLMLLIPFGTDNGSGNRSWLQLPFLPVNIQPAEFCKIGFLVTISTVLTSYQSRVTSWRYAGAALFHASLIVGLNMAISDDAGVSLIFLFIAFFLTIAAGFNFFILAVIAGIFVLAIPYIWSHMSTFRQLRLQIIWDPTIDPTGIGPRYHTIQSLRSLTGGGFSGQGLFNGHRTQMGGVLPAQHTDYIFSAMGEELGFLGCFAIMILLTLIIIRCFWVGSRSKDFLRRMICYGAGGALMFQVIINIGMCIGLLPVIGLTLPFFSYGGSSIISIYTMLGLVSGVYARPEATAQERYIRPPYQSRLRR